MPRYILTHLFLIAGQGALTMCIYNVLIDAVSTVMIHVNLNTIFYTHVKHSPANVVYIMYYLKKRKKEREKKRLTTVNSNHLHVH